MKKKLFDAALLSAGRAVNRAPVAAAPAGSWYKINDATEEAPVEVDIFVYDEIGFWGITANDFVRDLVSVSADTINLHINSPGGSVFDGVAIYNALVQHKARVVVHIDGWAASIASVIAMAGDEIRIAESASLMIHKPWSFVIGDADLMRAEAEVLDKLQSAIGDVYEARTDGDRAEIDAWVNAETWFKGQEAVDAGFADVMVPNKKKEKPAARLDGAFYAATFKHLPADVRTALAPGQPPAAQRPLPNTKAGFRKDIQAIYGCSRSMADSIANNGFRPSGDARDEPPEGHSPTPDPRDEDGARAAEHVAALARVAGFIRSLSN